MKSKCYELLREQVYSDRLANGMPVFVVKKAGMNKTFAFFATRYGGADRRFKYSGEWIDSPEGVAHFLEHKMFDTESGNALTTLSANGAQPNAFTSTDITAYHFESVDKFYENLEILLDFVSVPYFTEESVSKEQGIIGQEIRMYEDDPGTVMYYALMKLLFRENPLRDNIAGTVESISEITAGTLYRCHKIFYNPSNMALCVAGDVDPDRVFEIAARVLPKEGGSAPKRDYGAAEPLTPAGLRDENRMDVSEPMYCIGAAAAYPGRGEERMHAELIGSLAAELIAGKSSPLYLRLYGEGLIKSDFDCGFESAAGVACTIFGGSGQNPDAVFEAIKAECARTAAEGVDETRLLRVKKAAFGREMRTMNSPDKVCYRFVSAHFAGYDYYRSAEAIDSVASEELQSFVAQNLKSENLALSVVLPVGGEGA